MSRNITRTTSLIVMLKIFRFPSTVLIVTLCLATLSFSTFADDNEKKQQPSSGELVLPSDYETGEEKKCMTVCEQWGEDCIINPATGSRKCRRVCKSFTEECF